MDYIKSTNFASKDSLASGNPLKIVKGTEIDTEFNNIATAVATKADISSLGTISSQNANNVNVTGGSVTGLSSLTTTGAATIGGQLNTGTVVGTARAAFVSPAYGSSGTVVLRDAAGNPDAVFLQAANNAWSIEYGWLKFNSNGTLTPSGTIIGDISGNAATATSATTATTCTTAIGYSQTWQSVSRSAGTDYQNTTGKPIQVSIVVTGGDTQNATFYVGTSTSSYVQIGYSYQVGAATYQTVTFIVPNNHYYKVVLSGDTVASWTELR